MNANGGSFANGKVLKVVYVRGWVECVHVYMCVCLYVRIIRLYVLCVMRVLCVLCAQALSWAIALIVLVDLSHSFHCQPVLLIFFSFFKFS